MKYAVKITKTGETKEPTDNYVKACSEAISYSNWNIPCDVIDLETGNVEKHFTAYSDIFKDKTA